MFGEDAAVLREKDFQLLLLVSVTVPFGNGVLSSILDSLIEPLGTSVTTIGLMISVFWAPSIVIVPIVGILADRYGRKPILAPSLILFGLSGALIALATDFWMALALRLLQGVGWAGLTALIVTSIGDLYVGSKETTAQGLRQGGTGLAGGTVSLLAGVLVIIAWQYPFMLYLLTVPVAIAVYMWFDEPMVLDGDEASTGRGGDKYTQEIFGLIRQRRVFMILLGRLLPVVIFIGFLTYNSVLVVRVLHGTPAQAGILYALASVVYAGAASQVGRVTSLMGGRYRTLLGANGCLGGGLAVVFLAPDLVIAGLGVIFVGIGFGLSLPVYRTLITSFASDSLRAGLVSIGSTGGRVMGVFTPIAMGGVIAALTPVVGFDPAVQLTGLGTAVVGGGGGIACILVARASPQVITE